MKHDVKGTVVSYIATDQKWSFTISKNTEKTHFTFLSYNDTPIKEILYHFVK